MAMNWHENEKSESIYINGYGHPPVLKPRASHAGMVLGFVSRSERIMSDVWAEFFYAKVWNPELRKVEEVYYGNSEFGKIAAPAVCASPAVMAAANAYEAVVSAKHAVNEAEREIARAHEAASELRLYVNAKVIKGRKVPVGAEGRVFWLGHGNWGLRAGLELANGNRVFLAASNLKVLSEVEPEVLASLEENLARAKSLLAVAEVALEHAASSASALAA